MITSQVFVSREPKIGCFAIFLGLLYLPFLFFYFFFFLTSLNTLPGRYCKELSAIQLSGSNTLQSVK